MDARKTKLLAGFGLAAVLAVLVVLVFPVSRAPAPVPEAGPAAETKREKAAKPAVKKLPAADRAEATGEDDAQRDASAGEASADEPLPETDEDREEKLVNAFDDLTDAWQEPTADKVTMDEVARFREQFNKVPKARKDECIHRALNLIPDENVMLLAGILLDKTQEKDILETVYGDILNRDEDVKRPILQELFKDKTHPCWADTAWILDVTDDLPNKNKGKDE